MKSVTITLWDGTNAIFSDIEVHIPTPGIYRVVIASGNFIEYPFSSIKYDQITESVEAATE